MSFKGFVKKSTMKYLILVALSALVFSCCIDGDNCRGHYIFDVPISVAPLQATYQVGDTINFKIFTDNLSLRDTTVDPNRVVEFPDFDPQAWFLMPMIDTFPAVDGFVVNTVLIDSSFIVDQHGLPQRTSGIFFVGIDATAEYSRIELDVVLKRKGTYAFYAETELFTIDYNNFIDFPDRCGTRRNSTLDVAYSFAMDNKGILSQENIDIEKDYWKDYQGQFRASKTYYFRVE